MSIRRSLRSLSSLVPILWLGCGQGADLPASPMSISRAALRGALPICPSFSIARGQECERLPWAEISAQPTDPTRLVDVQDVDGARLWIAGSRGALLRSIDGGATIGLVDPGTGEDLFGVSTYDDRHLILTGAGHLHLSNDGGLSFWASAVGPADLGKCTWAPHAAAVCDASISGSVYRYDLSRDRFETVATLPGAPGPTITRAGRRVALALVSLGDTTAVLRSSDGGRSFGAAPVATLPAPPASLWISGNDRLALAGMANGDVYRTADGGLSFAQVYAAQNAPFSHYGPALVSGADDDNLFAAIGHTAGFRIISRTTLIIASTDGGATFSERGTLAATLTVSFGTSAHGILLGARLLRTTDGGASADPIDHVAFPITPEAGLSEIDFPTRDRGYVTYAVSRHSDHPAPPLAIVGRTDDGGLDFTTPLTGAASFGELATIGPDHVLVLNFPPSAAGPSLLRSDDGALTFSQVTVPDPPAGPFAFATPALGLATSRSRTAGQQLFRTTDGGATFTGVTLPTTSLISAIAFADTAHAVILCGDGTILASGDGGVSFSVRRPAGPDGESLTALALARPGPVGWAGGANPDGTPLLLRTRDFGATWVPQHIAGSPPGSVARISAGGPALATALLVGGVSPAQLIETRDGSRWAPRSAPPGIATTLFRRGRTLYVGSDISLYRAQAPGDDDEEADSP